MMQTRAANLKPSQVMSLTGLRRLVFLVLAVFIASAGSPGVAQTTGDAKTKDQPKAEANKEATHLAEVARQLQGPAGQPECAHIGENAISLMMRNDVDTALRHMDLYDRFGCPGAHVQASFRCALLIGTPAAKDTRSLEEIVRACWLNPAAPNLTPPAAAAPAAAQAPTTRGTGAH
jgi:hypothetical protein